MYQEKGFGWNFNVLLRKTALLFLIESVIKKHQCY